MTQANSPRLNAHSQPIGHAVANWTGSIPPEAIALNGRYTKLEPLLKAHHMQDLFEAFMADETGQMWTYMPVGPFRELPEFEDWIDWATQSDDPLFWTITDNQSGKAVGFASLLRIKPEAGVIEVGYIAFSPILQRTPLATEAMFLLMRYIFEDLGYRRYEWKCDDLNERSNSAAKRLGFSFEGVFRQAQVYKGRNRDTAWYSILDKDWPRLKIGFEAWLAPDNFDSHRQQKKSLSELIPSIPSG